MTVAEHPGKGALRPAGWVAPRRTASGEAVDLFFSTLMLPIDFLALVAAFASAYAVQVSLVEDPQTLIGLGRLLTWLLILAPLWILAFALAGLYSGSSVQGRGHEVGRVWVAVSGGVMLLLVADSVSPLDLFSTETMPVVSLLLGFAFVLGGREGVRSVQRALFAHEVGVRRAVVIGSGPIAQRVVQALTLTSRSGYRVVGVIDRVGSKAQAVMGAPVYPSLDEAQRALGGGFDEFIEADSKLRRREVLEILRFAADHHYEYRLVPAQFGLNAPSAAVGTLAGIPFVRFRHTPLDGWGRVIKRAFDLVGAAAGLLLLTPVFAGIALLIGLRDPGPVFFRQLRLGRAGEPFYIYKFRTMQMRYSGRPPLEVFSELGRDDLVEEFLVDHKVKEDPRVSRLGAFLRRSSLDELPQLWNVLVGDLSLVGPRPIVQEELEKFGESRATILALKPGVTGLWQISGRNDIDYDERVRLNISYVQNWTLRLDVGILVRTVLVLVKGGGAY